MDMGKLNVNLSPEGERVLRLMMTPYVGSVCAVCGVEYDTVDNLIARNPISTPTFPDRKTGLVDRECWLPAFDAWFGVQHDTGRVTAPGGDA
jgi:hypothetical protein